MIDVTVLCHKAYLDFIMPLSNPQQLIANDPHRFRVAICGRRFGKTHLSIRELCKFARLPEREVFYVAPTYRQAKQIVWRKLKNKLIDLKWVKKTPNETELSILLKNNSTISLKGADNFDSLRGVGLDFIVLDEFADINPDAWYEVLRPALSDRQGQALFIGTPKGKGNWSFDLFQMPLTQPEQWAAYQYTTLDGGNVTAEEIELARRDLDERTFRQEFLATFETYGNVIAYAFKREHNIQTLDNPNLSEIIVGMDFNVDPMTASIMVRQANNLYVIDEIYTHNSNTAEIAEEIRRRYAKSQITVYPDPASRQRKTSAGGLTDFTILQNAGFKVLAPARHNLTRDRINSLNARLCTSDGRRHLFIDPRCKRTIESLEKFAYKEGTQIPDKDSGYDHMFDALSYAVDYLFPLKKEQENLPIQRFGHKIQ